MFNYLCRKIKSMPKLKQIIEMTKEESKKLYEQLRLFRGAIGEVAEILGTNHEVVRKTIRDSLWNNEKYVKAAQEVIARRKAEVLATIA